LQSIRVAPGGFMAKLTVTAKGQVTLRQDLLRHLGVQPGQQIEVTALPGGRVEVRAAQPTGSIEAFIGRLAGRTAKVATLEEIQAAASAGWAGQP
jgi:bifunctional DNA-binding transcriptional regulator/antitoxin component of YhaV-PrlF toxin-antitoxin module